MDKIHTSYCQVIIYMFKKNYHEIDFFIIFNLLIILFKCNNDKSVYLKEISRDMVTIVLICVEY